MKTTFQFETRVFFGFLKKKKKTKEKKRKEKKRKEKKRQKKFCVDFNDQLIKNSVTNNNGTLTDKSNLAQVFVHFFVYFAKSSP